MSGGSADKIWSVYLSSTILKNLLDNTMVAHITIATKKVTIPFTWRKFPGQNNAMSHSWSSLRTLACKNRGQPLLCGNLLGFHSLVDEEQELKDARDADDDEIPVRLGQYVMELKKETHQRLIVGGERRCSILLSP